MQLESGQVAVVTGAASGLGLGLAGAFAARGLRVVLSDVEGDRLAEAVETVERRGAPAIGVPADVRFRDQVDALATATLERFGRVDVICNNAGVTTLGPGTWAVSPNDWEWVLGVNLYGVLHGIQAFVPHLVAQNSGHVVNTASMAGLAPAAPNHAPYVVSKHAVVALSEALATDLRTAAPNVGVTVVSPGRVVTDIHLAERNRPEGLTVEGGRELHEQAMPAMIEWSSTISGPPISSEQAAEIVMGAIESNRLHVAPNGTVAAVRARCDQLLADLER